MGGKGSGGHNRKSTRLRVLQGQPEKRQGRVKARPVMPQPPKWLSKSALLEWRRLAPEMEGLGILTQLDQAAFAIYCTTLAHIEEIEQQLATEGWVITGYRGALRKHPLVSVLNGYRLQLRQWAAELGLTPASRERLSVATPDDTGCLFCSLPELLCGCSR